MRTISDTGIIIVPIIPWNVNSIIIRLVTGVSCLSYAPYAVLCFFFPIITILLAMKIK
ncbi:Na+/H+ antiporter NhaC family protein [Faecalimicrobium sp. JNUCC 81]